LRIVTTACTTMVRTRDWQRALLRSVNFASRTLHMHASAETKSSTYGIQREPRLFIAAISGFLYRQHIILYEVFYPLTDYNPSNLSSRYDQTIYMKLSRQLTICSIARDCDIYTWLNYFIHIVNFNCMLRSWLIH
jgi:hypothetical protein